MLDRRTFLSLVPAVTAGASMLLSPRQVLAAAAQEQKGISAVETLMRGHGLLLRALIVYDTIKDRLNKGQPVEPSQILKTAGVFHDYLEEFHEKAEEAHIFAPMEKANIVYADIQELKIQHGSGFELTRRITELAKAGRMGPEMIDYLDGFVRMYRHHSAWEDTVVFPAFDNLQNKHQLSEFAANLAADERSTLGHNGFQTFVDQIAAVEKQLGIYELATSTPKL